MSKQLTELWQRVAAFLWHVIDAPETAPETQETAQELLDDVLEEINRPDEDLDDDQ